MTKVTFENATIRDAIGKAARIAPTKGSAFDQAAGIHMEIDAQNEEVIIRANNTEVFYMEIVDVVSIEGDSCVWLLPSVLLDGICNKLPITSGANTTFEADGATLRIKQKRMVANLRLMDPTYYATWEAFDPADLGPVSDFGGRLQQVQWAASRDGTPPLTGINLNGTHAGATDSFRVAITPCEVPQLYEPVTIPAATFTPLMKTLGEVRIGRTENQLLVMPDETTQIRATIYAAQYPNLAKVWTRAETNAVMVNKEHLLEMIEQAMVMGQRDRTPILKLILGQEEIAVLMEDQELGLLGNVLEVPGQCVHDRMYLGITPDNIIQALRACPNTDVTLWYTLGMPKKPIRMDGGSGYEVLIMPRNLEKSAEDA